MLRPALVVCFVCLLAMSPPTEQEEKNNCHDPAAWADWNERVTKYPDDKELQVLHALWIGLCVKVEKGEISFDDAMATFENARNALIQKRREERREKPLLPAL
jgi:hypothetical protein